MGRKKINESDKKKTLTINIPTHLFEQLEEKQVKNKSKLFNWLLEQHFGILENK